MTETDKPTVLFVCVSNAGKSVMAQALLRYAAGDRITALSAGTRAKTRINPISAQALAELDIDVGGQRPTQLSADLLNTADLVVILGTEAHIEPPSDGTPIERWNTDEPSHRGIDGIERMRLVRDDIAARTTELANRRWFTRRTIE